WTVGFMNDTLFGEWITPWVASTLENIGCAEWLVSLIADGIIGGVGAVLGFVPQMLILFMLISILEDIGYMSRVAFIMDRLFRKFGLSGKSFIPLLVSSGCGVPGVMASRTIEQERDRRMTIVTTCFIPCGAKMPIVGLIAGALFGGSSWIATSAYFIGVAAVIVSGIILKKTKMFSGDPAPFVMELPAYHTPLLKNIMRTTWDRGWGFIKRAGTVILAASIIIWVLNSLTFEGGFHYITGDEKSILNVIGEIIAFLFIPLGFGKWQAAVATVLGLVAKEEVVGVLGSLSSMASADAAMGLVEAGDSAKLALIGQEFFDGSRLAAFSFMIFNLLCAPCFAAMGAIKREMNSPKWTWFAIGYMTAFAYAISLIVYQIGLLITGTFSIWSVVAIIVLAALNYLLVRKNKYSEDTLTMNVK
ncbi:MAG: ferrous iron transporter B, partial [Oscillospiraceae bacterium]|nr:ferrous iron transporter B [Oscillospiraceae bacterium]